MAHITTVKVNVHATRKRSDGDYGSDEMGASASLEASVAPGDDIGAVLRRLYAHGENALRAELPLAEIQASAEIDPGEPDADTPPEREAEPEPADQEPSNDLVELRVKLDPSSDDFETVKEGLKDRDFEWLPGPEVWKVELDASLADQVEGWLEGFDVGTLNRRLTEGENA